MCEKVDVSKIFCDGEHKFSDAIKEKCQVSCIEIFF